MGLQEIIDSVPLAIFLVLAILSMIFMIEVGFRGGKYKRGKPDKAQTLYRPSRTICLVVATWARCPNLADP